MLLEISGKKEEFTVSVVKDLVICWKIVDKGKQQASKSKDKGDEGSLFYACQSALKEKSEDWKWISDWRKWYRYN
jgi:hypothetical protein